MKVLNIHQREIKSPKNQVLSLFHTLSQQDDKMWPSEKWPRMKLENGLAIGSAGGHGPIRYTIVQFDEDGMVEFRFQKPVGFHGTHKLEITRLDDSNTQITHTIAMETSGMGTLGWIFVIRWLHDALVEDAFDKIEHLLTGVVKRSEWNFWVKFLRASLKSKTAKS